MVARLWLTNGSGRLIAEALRPKPALVIAHHLAAIGTEFLVGRSGWFRHLPRLAREERFVNSGQREMSAFDIPDVSRVSAFDHSGH